MNDPNPVSQWDDTDLGHRGRVGTWSAFAADTVVARTGDDLYTGVLTDRWDRLGGGPLGGYTLAVALGALSDRMGAAHPLVLSSFFLRPAMHGRAEIDVTPVRSGRRYATGRAILSQGGKEVLHVTATYGSPPAKGRTATFSHPPALPAPAECVDPLEGLDLGGVTIRERVECRFAEPPGWRHGAPSGMPAADFWMRLVGVGHHTPSHLPLLVDAAAPMVLELGELGSTTLELTVHLRRVPEAGWLACRAMTRHVIDGLHEEDFEIWDASGQLVAQSRQLAVLP